MTTAPASGSVRSDGEDGERHGHGDDDADDRERQAARDGHGNQCPARTRSRRARWRSSRLRRHRARRRPTGRRSTAAGPNRPASTRATRRPSPEDLPTTRPSGYSGGADEWPDRGPDRRGNDDDDQLVGEIGRTVGRLVTRPTLPVGAATGIGSLGFARSRRGLRLRVRSHAGAPDSARRSRRPVAVSRSSGRLPPGWTVPGSATTVRSWSRPPDSSPTDVERRRLTRWAGVRRRADVRRRRSRTAGRHRHGTQHD